MKATVGTSEKRERKKKRRNAKKIEKGAQTLNMKSKSVGRQQKREKQTGSKSLHPGARRKGSLGIGIKGWKDQYW